MARCSTRALLNRLPAIHNKRNCSPNPLGSLNTALAHSPRQEAQKRSTTFVNDVLLPGRIIGPQLFGIHIPAFFKLGDLGEGRLNVAIPCSTQQHGVSWQLGAPQQQYDNLVLSCLVYPASSMVCHGRLVYHGSCTWKVD